MEQEVARLCVGGGKQCHSGELAAALLLLFSAPARVREEDGSRGRVKRAS
jgi:hypothetical protein